MKYDFAALRFTEDPNLKDRVYWYQSAIPLKEGERVLAPVGAHDRLQAARVEKTLSATEENAPYDLRLIKGVTAKFGARKLLLGETELLEFGGVRYDEKHYTPYGRLVLSKTLLKDRTDIAAYGITKTLSLPADDPALYEEIARAAGGVLLFGGEGERAFRLLYSLLRGEKGAAEQIGEETAMLLKEKLR